MKPKLTVSGYRGVWGDTLTEDIAREHTRAFGAFVQKRGGMKILVGRDGRESGPALMEAVIAELLSLGFDVFDLGMMPTPVVVWLVREEKAGGAVIITASHNPIEYNGLKFVTGSGAFTTQEEVTEIERLRGPASTRSQEGLAQAPEGAEQPDGQQAEQVAFRERVLAGPRLFETYLEHLLKNIDVELIRSKKFKVALDPINSVGCTTTPKLFDALGVTYSIVNGEPNGKFAHAPEPIEANLSGLETLVKETKSDIGFAQDPDGDRLVFADETGTMVFEESMLALCVKAVMEKTPGPIVLNAVTSTVSRDIAKGYGQETFRSKVGEANVVEIMSAKNAVIGGEGSGGVIWPTANAARDSFVGIALILELMARTGKSASALVAELPKYEMAKDKVARTGELAEIYQRFRTAFPEGKASDIDGQSLEFSDGSWVNIRPSNTEPIIRIFAEAPTKETAFALVEKAKKAIF